MRLALFQPDIPQNVGGSIRLASCFGVPLDLIEPCGFALSDKSLRRTAMDYGRSAVVVRHDGWAQFLANASQERIILFTTQAEQPFQDFRFAPDDILLFGSESTGAPPQVHAAASARVCIPIAPQARSLNLVTAAAIGIAEALRQTGGLPRP